MRGIILTFLGIILGLIILAKLPVVLGYILNIIGFKPGMDTHIDPENKRQFELEKFRQEKKGIEDMYEYSQGPYH